MNCKLCCGTINVGEDIWPMVVSEEKQGTFVWSHLACAEASGDTARRPPCKHWLRNHRCQYGDACFFSHDVVTNLDPRRTRAWGGKRNVVRKSSRASVFRRFLLDHFGLETLCGGSGVVDVAGGCGELAFELLNLNGIETACVDPRPPRIGKYLQKWQRGLYWWNPIWRSWNGERPSDQAQPRSPQHLRLLFDETLTCWAAETSSAGRCTSHAASCLNKAVTAAQNLQWTRQGLHEEDIDTDPNSSKFYPNYLRKINFGEDACEDTHEGDVAASESDTDAARDGSGEPAITEDEALAIAKLFTGCSVVVGLHPDQAAGHIAEWAIATRKPFAVVPCCVYAAAFPKRKLPDGTPVKTWQQLIQYLVSLEKGVCTDVLDFEGKNVVVYWSPNRMRG